MPARAPVEEWHSARARQHVDGHCYVHADSEEARAGPRTGECAGAVLGSFVMVDASHRSALGRVRRLIT